MSHQVIVNAPMFVKALKDASLYLAKDAPIPATSYILLELNQKQKTLSIIACDGHGYYENELKLVQCKGVKQSLPGKPMRLLISRESITPVTKHSKCAGDLVIEADDSQIKAGSYPVKITFPDEEPISVTSPVNMEIPDYAKISKQAEKGKKASVNMGQVMLPVKELTRAGKVFPIAYGTTIPMYVCPWQKHGLLTLLEYTSEIENVRVIFALSLPEAA